MLIPPHCGHLDSGAASPNRAGAAHHLHGPAYRDGAALTLTARKVDSDFGCTKSGGRAQLMRDSGAASLYRAGATFALWFGLPLHRQDRIMLRELAGRNGRAGLG